MAQALLGAKTVNCNRPIVFVYIRMTVYMMPGDVLSNRVLVRTSIMSAKEILRDPCIWHITRFNGFDYNG